MPHIQLTQGCTAHVDVEDYEYLNQWKWYARVDHGGRWYAIRRERGRMTWMHRVILERKLGRRLKQGEMTDHIRGRGLNNSRNNLRIATNAQNQGNQELRVDNTSGYKGVYQKNKKWYARIKIKGKEMYLGSFDDPRDAARAYDDAARTYHGRFARTNASLGLI